MGEYQSIFAGVFSEEQIGLMGDLSIIGGISGALHSMAGAYYQTQAQKDALKAEAQNREFAAELADMSAVVIENAIGEGRDALRQAIGVSQMQYSEAKAQAKTQAAARGVKVDTGSAAETQAALQLISDYEAMTMRVEAETQFAGMERQAGQAKIEATMGRLSARNMRATAKSMSPAHSFLTQAVSSAGQVSGLFYERFRPRTD